MANTSFPIGGENTHAVISAHTAFPGKEFFNRLTELEIGDLFYITVLGDTLAYEVCEINVVPPNDSEKLRIVKGEDLVTLVTCTPYSINTHRLLVRGKRVFPDDADVAVESEQKADNILPIILIVVLIAAVTIVLIIVAVKKRHRRKSSNEKA